MTALKQCPRGHYYKGDACPYCPTQCCPNSGLMRPTRTDGPNQHKPTFYPTDTPTSTIAGTDIPLCPHCGKPVRKEIPHCFNIGSIEGNAFDGKTPWNYNWKGVCESCGHDFSITMTQRIDSPHNDRQTIVRVSQRQVHAMSAEGYTLHDAFVGLSGVEIEQRNNIEGVKTTFISINELKYLISALKNSPLLEQLDFHADWT